MAGRPGAVLGIRSAVRSRTCGVRAARSRIPRSTAITIAAGRWWQAPGEVVLDHLGRCRHWTSRVGDTVSFRPLPKRGRRRCRGRRDRRSRTAGSPRRPSRARPRPDRRRHRRVGQHAGRRRLDEPGRRGGARARTPRRTCRCSTGSPRRRPTPTSRRRSPPLTAGLPADSVVASRTYLETKAGVNEIADLYVPVLLAFSIFALLAAAFTIANVVSGIVLTSYRDIGVMKAVGFTPGQVTLDPARPDPASRSSIGAVAGVIVGTLAAVPTVEATARSFGLPGAFSVSLDGRRRGPRWSPSRSSCSGRAGPGRPRRPDRAPSTRSPRDRHRRDGPTVGGCAARDCACRSATRPASASRPASPTRSGRR